MVRYHHRNEYFKYQPKSPYKNLANSLWDKLSDLKASGIFASLRSSENKIIENVLIVTTLVVFFGFIIISIYKILNDDKRPLDKVRNTVKRSSNCIFDILNAFWTIKEIHVTNLQLEDDNEKFLKLVQDNLKGIKDNSDSINTSDNCIDEYNSHESNQNMINNSILPNSSVIPASNNLHRNNSFISNTNSINKNPCSMNNNLNSGISKVSVSNKNKINEKIIDENNKHNKMIEKKTKNNIGVNPQGEDDALYQNITFQLDNIYSKNAERLKPVKLFEPKDFEYGYQHSETNNSNNLKINNSNTNSTTFTNKKGIDKENRNVTFECSNYIDDPIIMRPIKKNQPTTSISHQQQQQQLQQPSTAPPTNITVPSSSNKMGGLSGNIKTKEEVFRTNKAFDKRLLLNKGEVAAKRSVNSVNEYKGIFAPRKN